MNEDEVLLYYTHARSHSMLMKAIALFDAGTHKRLSCLLVSVCAPALSSCGRTYALSLISVGLCLLKGVAE